MAKRADKGHDSTQELSASQLVVPPRNAPPQVRRANPNNDASTWGQVVVGTADFAPAPMPVYPGRSRRALVLGGLGVVIAGGVGGYVLYTRMQDRAPSAASAAVTAPAPAATPLATPGPVIAPAIAPVDAAVAVVSADAAPTPMALETTVDAVSGVGPPIFVKKKKPPAKKKPAAKRPKR
ncbi:MAG: hypothetical protein H0T89_25640 [Deltaproteobacteria bacterium]|nr:hypothetical protein [Deltaproteobacteria bacterium]MDQ3300259.1 hypothetical protein [Myxococcota bacterium]